MKPKRMVWIALTALTVTGGATSRNTALERNKELLRRAHAEVWSQGNLAAVDELYATNFVCHFIAGIEWKGLDGLKAAVRQHRASFPDWHEHIEQIVAEGDFVVTRFTSTGTQRGVFNGLAPTGKSVKISELAVHRIANGKIAEQWGSPDAMGLEQQLGASDSEAENRRMIRRYFDEWVNRGNAAVADELLATNLVVRNPPAVLNGLEEYQVRMAAFHAAFPDGRYTIEDEAAESDRVVVRWTLRGTQRGEFQGRPPTDKAFAVTGTSIFRLDGGKIREIWVNMDRLGMMQQLGWLPAAPR